MAKHPFIHDDFLLQSRQARELYHEHAADLPIVDYHCHLPPEQVAADQRWENLTQVWLYGDHYKWRAMRSNGVPERFCTGDASDREKFQKYAECMPYMLRNPLYSWTQLELARYFGVYELLGPDTAEDTWRTGREVMASPDFSARGLMTRSNVVLVCTTDDPVDSLEHHLAVAADPSFPVRVLPTWRPDKGMAVENPEAFNAWVDRLAAAADTDIGDYDDYLAALRKRHAFFHEAGCRLSDHGVETVIAEDYTDGAVRTAFAHIRSGKALLPQQVAAFKSAMLVEFGIMDAERDWTQQVHLGAMRNNNTRRFEELGPDTGFDSIGDFEVGRALSRWLDRLDRRGKLTRTILYNLNPRDHALMATMLGNFQDGSVPGKMQHGSGWWFLDHKYGMEEQMQILSNMGLLSRFVGMLTDSRSFLSYTRHEYFRRVLCNLVGSDMAQGIMPDDMSLASRLVKDVCYRNAARYFGFDLPV